MNVDISWWGVILATVSSMIVGSIWYAKPIFGVLWAKLVHLDEKRMAEGATRAIIITIFVSFLTAYVLAHAAYLSNSFFQNSFLQDSLSTAFWLWLGFAAARFITHDVFERRPTILTMLNVAHEFVTIMIMGLVIGLLQP